MKNKEIFTLREALNEVDYIRGKSFAYAVFKNKDLLDKEIETIEKLKKQPHPDYFNYENERTLLCQLYSEKDANGNPVVQYNQNGSQEYIIQNKEEFGVEYGKLAEKYNDVLQDVNSAKNEFEEFLEKDSDLVLKTITMEDLPNDISASFLEKIKYMIA